MTLILTKARAIFRGPDFFTQPFAGVIVLPTQTMHGYKGNPSKLPQICICCLLPPSQKMGNLLTLRTWKYMAGIPKGSRIVFQPLIYLRLDAKDLRAKDLRGTLKMHQN